MGLEVPFIAVGLFIPPFSNYLLCLLSLQLLTAEIRAVFTVSRIESLQIFALKLVEFPALIVVRDALYKFIMLRDHLQRGCSVLMTLKVPRPDTLKPAA